MADKVITQDEWESAVALFMRYGNSPIRVAKKLGWTLEQATRLYEEGTANGFPAIALVVAERKAAKKAEIPRVFQSVPEPKREDLHVVDRATHDSTAVHTSTHTDLSSGTSPSAAPHSPTPNAQASPQSALHSAPAPIPLATVQSPPTALASAQSSADELAQALDSVHRDLAQALGRESLLVRALREQAIGLASGGHQAVKAFDVIMTKLCAKLIQASMRDDIEERRAFTILTKLARLTKASVDHAREAIELQRLMAGLPQSISATTTTDGGADRVDQLREMTRKLEELASRRERVIDVNAKVYSGEETSK